MYKTYYEISRVPLPIDFILGMVIFSGGLVAIIRALRKSERWNSRLFEKIVGSILVFFGALMLVLSVKSGGSAAYSYAKRYYSGEYQSVEGDVKNYTEIDGEGMSFEVNNIYFEDVGSIYVGYHIKNHSVITRNGQSVRITYIYSDEYKMNFIMKIEEKYE